MSASGEQRSVAFFPWLRLGKTMQVGSIRFIPFAADSPDSSLASLTGLLRTILSGYRDIQGQPYAACTVAFPTDRQPGDHLSDSDLEAIQTAAAFLCLAAVGKNDYCSSAGSYANSSVFQAYFQYFTDPVEYIGLRIRRRDGRTTDAGYKHGEAHFTVPIQCSYVSSPVEVDADFAQALARAHADGFPLARRLLPAIQFFNLANTDSQMMLPRAELILIGAAYEQLLDADGAYDLQCKVGARLNPYGSIRVEDALICRQGIGLNQEYESAQSQWFVYRKWVEELHNLRSVFVHGQDRGQRAWGWEVREHLVMGAFVFPLLVKLCLAKKGYYCPTLDDRCRCAAIDPLLSRTQWFERVGRGMETGWQETLRKVSLEQGIKWAFDQACKQQRGTE